MMFGDNQVRSMALLSFEDEEGVNDEDCTLNNGQGSFSQTLVARWTRKFPSLKVTDAQRPSYYVQNGSEYAEIHVRAFIDAVAGQVAAKRAESYDQVSAKSGSY